MGQEASALVDDGVAPRRLSARTLAAVAEYINAGPKKRVVVLTGAGISTAAGIPDFRSPKTGLYGNLARLDLPYAEAVFDISYFRQRPEPFYVLARELYPGRFRPTVSHAFIALLAQKGLLQMLFTQNIDCLERAAGVPADRIVEAHGSFATQRCVECKAEFPDEDMRRHVLDGRVPRCAGAGCGGVVKPDIVFFGEPLPRSFDRNAHHAAAADAVLILGTSLSVYPFAGLPETAAEGAPRVLFNMERVGRIGGRPDDVVVLGPCDDGVRRLADALGWRDELERLWRGVVGEDEAERQLRNETDLGGGTDEEMQRLAEGIEAALSLGRADDGDGDDDGETRGTEATERGEKDGAPSSLEEKVEDAEEGSEVATAGQAQTAEGTQPPPPHVEDRDAGGGAGSEVVGDGAQAAARGAAETGMGERGARADDAAGRC